MNSQVDLIGTSMGGILGMMIAAQKPDFIKRLVLNDIGAVVSAQGLLRIVGYIGNHREFADKADAMAYAKWVFAPFGIRSEEHWQQVFKASFIKLGDGRYVLAFRASGIKFNAQGEHSDLLSHATAKAMCDSKPQAELVEWAGIGHAPSLLEPAQIDLIAI